jgi:ParB-like chromosome segregation protein Spo0J
MKTIADKPHTVAIADIKVSNRHRREMGDIASLAGSMGELGLLQPVVVRDQSAPS